MIKFIKRVLLVAALLLPWAMTAQTHYNLQIGTGTATSQYVPDYSYYSYCYTQMLYTAAEVGIDGEIDTIAFQVSSGSSTRTVTVYMAEVSQSNLTSQVAASELHQVFSGSVSWSSGWVTIPLDSVFDYQDTGSLVIAFIDGTGTWASGYPYFNGTSMSETRARYIYNDNNSYTTSTSTTYTNSFLPNIRIGISSYSTYCATPSNVTIGNINNDEADISWTENGNATEWEVIVSDSAITDFVNASSFTATSNPYTVSNLAGNTLYYVYVRAVCDATSASAWTNAATFRSACVGYTSIPYTTGFEELTTGTVPNCWQQVATGSSSAATFPAGYVYATNARNGNVYFEFESSTGQTEIVALPAMDNINSLMLTFYASCMNTNFVLEAGVMDGSTFEVIDTVQLTAGSSNNWHGSYYPYTVYYGNYNGTGERIAMRVTASGSYTLMMDDLTVDYIPTCPTPSNGSIDSTGSDWISFSWQENGTASSWEVAYGTGSFTPDDNTSGITAYDTYYTLGGLSGDSAYTVFVRANCGGGDYSNWLEVGTAIPGIYLMTLTTDTLYTCGVTVFDNGGPDGNYAGSSNNTLVIFPASTDSTLRIWGNVNTENGYDYVNIYDGVGTSGTQLYSGSGTATVGPFVSMAQAITIQFTSDGSVNYAGFELHASCVYMSGCVAPVAISVDSVLGDTVWVSWTDTASSTNFELVYGPAGFNPDTATVGYTSVSGTSEMLTGLTMGQLYEFYVRSDCGNEQSMWVGPVTATPGYSYTMAATGSDTLHVCGYTIYDNGGESGGYSSSCNSTLVVFPNDPTMTPVLSGSVSTESCCDHLYIYDGVGTSGTLLYQGEGNTSFSNILSEEGVVTIHFTSDGSIQNDGFVINVACVPLPDCPHPSQLTVSNIGTQTADISWVELGTASSWILQYDTVNFTPGDSATGVSMVVNTNPYTLTGLDSAMTYYVYVASFCDPDTSAFIGASFPTLAATPASLPYSCDFEQAGVNGWDLINGTQTNHWMVGTGVNNGGSRALYITNDDAANAYTTSSAASTVYASRTIFIDSVGEYAYSFDWQAYGESSWDYIRVALVPTTIDLTAGSLGSWGTTTLPSGAIALDGGSKLNLSSSWITRTGTVNITTTGAYNLVFLWRNDGSGGTQPPAAIDNVMLNRLSCSSPTNLVITRLTNDSVYLSWNGQGASGPWLVTYGNTSTTAYTTDAAIGGLTMGTTYTFSVATLCGSDTSFTISIQATPGSWTMRPNQTDTLTMCGGVIYDDGGANGNYSASQNSYIILMPAPNSLVSVSGTSYTESSYDYLTIYDGAGTSGTVLWSDNSVSGNQTFGPIESTNGPLTIYFHSDASVQYDGFAINVSCVTTSCRVMNLHLDAGVPESGSQLAIAWDAVPGAQSYQIEYGNVGFTLGQGQTMTSTTNSAIIGGLNSTTNYDVYVRSLCSGGDTGSWAHGTFATAMCDNPSVAFNYDTTMTATTSEYAPIGYSLYEYSYVQTLVDASFLSSLTGDITAMAFNVVDASTGGDEFENMTVWLANVADTDLSSGPIIPNTTDHIFVKVIDSTDFNFGTTTGWMIHSFDNAFSWDGQSNILVAVRRNNGNWQGSSEFAAHSTNGVKTIYYYQDDYAIDPSNPDADYDDYEYYSADIQLISCGGGCPRPAGVYANNVDYGSATLNWSGNAANYEVAVKAATEGTWPNATPVSATSYNVTGLSAATHYQFRVRAICDAAENLISDWIVGNFVTDSLPCFAPTDLQATATTYTTATFGWSAYTGQNQWRIRVWNSTFDEEYNANSNPFTVTGLTQTTTYFATVSAVCGGGAAVSDNSDTIQFTTATCAQVTGVTATVIDGHSATVSWNDAGVTTYQIEYGYTGFTTGQGHTVTADNVTSYTITGLESETGYDVYVRAMCETGVYGGWSYSANFTTPEGNGISTADGMNVSIYPNPTSSSTTIALNGINGEVAVSIVDMNGHVVMSDSMSCEGDCTKTMEVSGLAQGAYFVRISGEGVNMVKKLVVK